MMVNFVDSLRPLVLLAVVMVQGDAFQSPEPDLEKQARAELFAARYDKAIELYRKSIAQGQGADCYYGLTRALLKDHRSKEAYAVAEEALQRAPQTAGAQTAAGLAKLRKGELGEAEHYFHAALNIDPHYSGALRGLATIFASVSRVKTARDLLLQAYAATPSDPVLMLARANTLKGDPHLAALEEVLPLLDPESEEARGLLSHIASDRALKGRKVRRLVSANQPTRVKLVHIGDTPTHKRGFGLRVQFNELFRHSAARYWGVRNQFVAKGGTESGS